MALVPHAAGTSPVPPVMRRATIAARLPQKTVTLNHPSTEYYVLFIRRIRFRRGNTVANAGGFPEGSRQIQTEIFLKRIGPREFWYPRYHTKTGHFKKILFRRFSTETEFGVPKEPSNMDLFRILGCKFPERSVPNW
jgi:hypothetical protein